MISNKLKFCATAAVVTLTTACSDNEPVLNQGRATKIVAEIADPQTDSRTAISNGNVANPSFFGIMWEAGDQIGAYGKNGSDLNVPSQPLEAQAKKATFSVNTTEIDFLYYPYNANAGSDKTALKGELPTVQNVGAQGSTRVIGDYKVGRDKGVTDKDSVQVYSFDHLFAMGRIALTCTGAAEGEKVESVTIAADTDLSGDFTFNATVEPATYTVTNGKKEVTVTWDGGVTGTGSPTYAFFSMFPTVEAGNSLTITITTDKKTATKTFTATREFSAGECLNFPLSVNLDPTSSDWAVKDNGTTEPEPEPTELTGTFTCASLNVDGLPQKVSFFNVNKDGPGADGTKLISQAVANANWDFFAVSEDFEYDTELKSALSAYNSGTYRKPGDWIKALSGTLDTDGLNFFWKNGIEVTNETIVEYNDKKGDLSHGADEKIKKGFRHYEVTVAEGVTIDVYITHMNTYSGSGNTESNAYVKAVLSQLRQLRDYVLANVEKNNRPAIVMGDTNMRYTRHNIKANLVDVIAANSNVTFSDPWVDFHRGGKFPEWNTKSLMLNSMFKGDKENDIVCSDDQRGEVVDKIWVFNSTASDVQLEATNLYNDVSDNFVKSTETASYSGVTRENADGTIETGVTVNLTKKVGIADHFPVVADFKWTRKVATTK